MRRGFLCVAAVLFAVDCATAQERAFCEGDAGCSDDRLEVVFPTDLGPGASVYEYAEFVAGSAIAAGVAIDAATARADGSGAIQGFSYAVAHDAADLTLVADSITTDGTVIDQVFSNGFNVTNAVEGGWISGVVLSFLEDRVIPLGRNLIGRASYTLARDVGDAGTQIRFVSGEIGPANSPPTDINLTIDGRGFQPRIVVDGIVRAVGGAAEDCENGVDDDGDGLIDADDPDCHECPCGSQECPFAFYFGDDAAIAEVDARAAGRLVISSSNLRPLLGFQFGVTMADAGGATRLQFSGDLGANPARLVEIVMTDNEGNTIEPATPNSAIAPSNAIESISRGSAIAAFAGGDFLEFDLDPAVGGPGFFLGYVSDLDDDVNQIPATGEDVGQGCPLNELLIITFGAQDCPGFAYYFGGTASTAMFDARGASSFPISSRNTTALLGFQIGVRASADGGSTVYTIVDDLGTDADRLIEPLMTDVVGSSIVPATPNQARSDTFPIEAIERGAATTPFAGGDFFRFDLEPGVGGPGFFVGYVSDLDDDLEQIPATTGPDCGLNELLIVRLRRDGGVCPTNGFAFGADPRVDLDVGDGTSYTITARHAAPLLGFQLGVNTGNGTHRFSNDLGTSADRLIPLLMTDNLGNSIVPDAANEATVTRAVQSIERGSAIAAFAGGDFLEYDLEPGVGGPGYFVGYVTDLDGNVNQIPAATGDDCATSELLVVRLAGGGFVCPPENGYAFVGPTGALEETVDIADGTTFTIHGKSERPLLGFQLGVAVREQGDGFVYRFSGDLGTDGDRPIALLMTDNNGDSLDAPGANELLAAQGGVSNVERGAAIAAFEGGDFLRFDTAPGIGGPGFFVGYVSDLDGNVNQIPVGDDPDCPLVELLVVTVGGVDENLPFVRGDADGNSRINVSDAVIIIQEAVGNFAARFECFDRLDVDDDEVVTIGDALPLLAYIFQNGPTIPLPFPACGVDPTPGPLGCRESNCQ